MPSRLRRWGASGWWTPSGDYARTGGASLALGFVPQTLALRSPEAWEAVAADQHQLRRAFFRARCPPDAVEVVREPASRSDVADSPHFSLALARADRSLLVLDTANGTRVEICRSCQETPDAGTCPTTVERQATGGLTVASRHDGARVLGARRNGAGLIDLLERDLATDCGSPWTVLGTAPDSAAAVQWEPAMFGRKPGLPLQHRDGRAGLRSLERRSRHRAREPKRSSSGRSKVGLRRPARTQSASVGARDGPGERRSVAPEVSLPE